MPGKIEPGVGSSIRHEATSTHGQKGTYSNPHAPIDRHSGAQQTTIAAVHFREAALVYIILGS